MTARPIAHHFTEKLIDIAKKNKRIVVIDADLADDINLYNFQKKFPQRFIQNGIAEQDMVSMAGGMALNGIIPIVNSFASFLTSRANEQIYNNATEYSKIIYVSLYAGLLPAGAGKSHQSLRDISLISNIANFKIFHPSTNIQASKILEYCIKKEKSNCLIRLHVGPNYFNDNILKKNYSFKVGIGDQINNNSRYAIFCYGQLMLKQAVELNASISNVNFQIINFTSLNFFNFFWLKKILKNKKKIFIFDEHYKDGGFADLLISFIVNNDLQKDIKFYKICIDSFPACGTDQEVLRFHKIDVASLKKIVLRKLKK